MKPNDTSKPVPKAASVPSAGPPPPPPARISSLHAAVAPRPSLRPKIVNSPHDLQQGAVVGSRYVVERVIGEGNVSLVVAAKNLELGELVALKILKPEMLTQPGALARFGREAKASVQIRSEYAASVYDVGQLPDGTPYLVMEYLDGVDLERHVATVGALEVSECIECILQVCEALAIAHSKGIIHRDLKPENLFRIQRADGMFVVKVIDFGISKVALVGNVFGANLAATDTAGVSGTPFYMSPEQVSASANVDRRTDIWSLGVVMYEVLTGTVPFPAESFAELCSLVLTQPPPDVRTMRNDVPAEVAEAITRCLEKDPNKRFSNVAELAAALYPFAPKRARLNAERTVAVLKSAGMADVNLAIESIMPSPESAPSMPSIPRTRSSISGISGVSRTSQNPLPIDLTAPGSNPGSRPGSRGGNPAPHPASHPSLVSRPGGPWTQSESSIHVPTPPPSAMSRMVPVLVGASLALAAALSIAYFVLVKRKPEEAAAANPIATTTATPKIADPVPAITATTAVTASPAQPQAAVAVQAAAPVVQTQAPQQQQRWTWTPPARRGVAPAVAAPIAPALATVAPTATATAVTKPAKKSDEPDLGY